MREAIDGLAVSLRDVTFRWNADDPDLLSIKQFDIPKGECLFIKGASGTGKTTLLNVLAGVLTPNEGSVRVLDAQFGQMQGAGRDRFRADHIGVIFQQFNLLPYLSLIDNVTLPCRFSGKRRASALGTASSVEESARRLLAHLGLDIDSLVGRSVRELSVGQQQRVAAARALIGKPELIIADEPTSSLDWDVRENFLRLLFDEVAAAESTLVFVSHDTSLEKFFKTSLNLSDINERVN